MGGIFTPPCPKKNFSRSYPRKGVPPGTPRFFGRASPPTQKGGAKPPAPAVDAKTPNGGPRDPPNFFPGAQKPPGGPQKFLRPPGAPGNFTQNVGNPRDPFAPRKCPRGAFIPPVSPAICPGAPPWAPVFPEAPKQPNGKPPRGEKIFSNRKRAKPKRRPKGGENKTLAPAPGVFPGKTRKSPNAFSRDRRGTNFPVQKFLWRAPGAKIVPKKPLTVCPLENGRCLPPFSLKGGPQTNCFVPAPHPRKRIFSKKSGFFPTTCGPRVIPPRKGCAPKI